MKRHHLPLTLLLALLTFALLIPAASTAAKVLATDAESESAAAKDVPFLAIQPQDDAHIARLDIADLELPMVEILNPDAESPLDFQVLALDPASDRRRSVVSRLEADGSLTIAFKQGFTSLLVVARGPFQGQVSDLQGERSLPLAGTSVRATHGESSAGPVRRGLNFERICGGAWVLDCISPSSCTYTSPAYTGSVYRGDLGGVIRHDVNWNQQIFSIGDWMTSNSSGCWVSWTAFGSCPVVATNCYGQDYLVSNTIPIQ